MKIMGGLRGLTYRPAALTRFFLVAPELARLSGEADAMVGFTKRPAQHHHQLSEAVTRRQERMIKKLRSILEESNPFKHDGDDLVNIINKTVIPEHMKTDILRQYDVGQEAFKTFVTERILGPTSLWEPMKKVKLYKWNSSGEVTKTQVCNKILELKENRSLFALMAIAARSRPEIDMAQTVSAYEISGVPRSLIAFDGSLLPSQDKSKLMHILEEIPNGNGEQTEQIPHHTHSSINSRRYGAYSAALWEANTNQPLQ